MATKYARADERRWPGVYVYESMDRKYQGKPDVCLVISYKVDGKKRWEKVGWKSEGYTPQVAAEIRAERVKKARHGEEVMTAKEIRTEQARVNRVIDDIAREYFKQRSGNARAGQFDRYRYDKHVSPVLGQRRASSLGPMDVARIKANMKDYAPATVWGALEILRRIVNFGAKTGICPSLKFIFDMPKKDNEVVEYLEPEQAARFLEVLNNWPAQDVARMLKLAMFTGMRRGEIFKLQDHDVDFLQGLITLRKPKGGKTVSIPMNPIARDILEEQKAWRDERHSGSLFLFPGRHGEQRVDSSAVDRIKAKAGLPKSFRIFHGLRHHYAVTLANSGQFSLDMIAELLTHKGTAMTRRYGQFLPDTVKQASNLAAELLAIQATLKSAEKVVKIKS